MNYSRFSNTALSGFGSPLRGNQFMHLCHPIKEVAKDQRTNFLVSPLLANYEEMEAGMVWACRTPQQPLQKPFLRASEGGRRRGRHRKCWMDNIKKWTSLPMPELLTRASCRKKKSWKRIPAESSLMPPWRSYCSSDWTELLPHRRKKIRKK